MAGFDNDVLYGVNIDLTGAGGGIGGNATLLTDGQMLIASTALNAGGTHVNVGVLSSPLGTLSIGYSSPNITIDLAGGASSIEKINVDNASGTGTNPVVPSSGSITMTGGQYAAGAFGTRVIDISSSAANTVNILLQQSSAVGASNPVNNGISHFNSNHFSVDSNGFVSIINSGFQWTDVTTATQTLVVENGYVTDRGGGVTYTLPATAVLGNEIRIVGKSGLATITPNANQQIVMSSASGTVGATGTAVATNAGDCIDLICITAGASTVWRAANFVGNWTLN